MPTKRGKRARKTVVSATAEAAALEEMLDVLQPDRAHHDELGRTRNGTAEPASPREPPAAPLDVANVGE
jgi:hypothetical protein